MIYPSLKALSPQTPADYLDNTFDFSDLVPLGDAISTATMGSSDGSLHFSSVTIDPVAQTVVVWVTGGTANTTATLTCSVTTTGGRTFNRTATMLILPVI